MRRIAVIALTALASSAYGATLEIPTEGRVVLPGRWRPSGVYTDFALRRVRAFLENPVVSDRNYLSQIALIRQHGREYRVQFIGTFRNGHTVILCNFFPVRLPGQKEDPFSYWRSKKVEVNDGGFWFWRIEYDPADGRCTNFTSNGYG
jgi:hypothetical protein